MENLKRILQNQWENVGLSAKIYFKSHDLSKWAQPLLLFIPSLLSIISLGCDWIVFLDVASIIFSFFALIYFIYFGKNQELFMEWWDKYLVLYHEIETYYKKNKQSWMFEEAKIDEFKDKITDLNQQKRPEIHWWAKIWADKRMEKEMTYANEDTPWYKDK